MLQLSWRKSPLGVCIGLNSVITVLGLAAGLTKEASFEHRIIRDRLPDGMVALIDAAAAVQYVVMQALSVCTSSSLTAAGRRAKTGRATTVPTGPCEGFLLISLYP